MSTMAVEDEIKRLKDVIKELTDETLKAHMLQALAIYENPDDKMDTSANAVENNEQSVDDKRDNIISQLRTEAVEIQRPRDALYLAVHALLLEAGFSIAPNGNGRTAIDTYLPVNWNENSSNGLFKAQYCHPNDTSITYDFQGLFVCNQFEIYISDSKEKTHSISVDSENYIRAVEVEVAKKLAADYLKQLASLREVICPLIKLIVPPQKKPTAQASTRTPVFQDPFANTRTPDSSLRIPNVGRGDVFPPNLGGGDPSTLVGPDHAIFRGVRPDPTRGPVEGARFDPFGPIPGPRPLPGGRPAPGVPFGMPTPDHMRMPQFDNDDIDNPFPRGPRPPSRRDGPSSFGGMDHAFF